MYFDYTSVWELSFRKVIALLNDDKRKHID
jgi:hypothetical protein